MREAISVAECAHVIGLKNPPVLVGYVFDGVWATANRTSIDGFLAASAAAADLLARQPDEWQKIRPLMDAPGEALFQDLRSRFLAGTARPDAAVLAGEANALLAALAAQGVAAKATLPEGVFWRGA
jgi:NitT/TauT family transport system substrate-binding protein